MLAGRLDHRFAIEIDNITTDANGKTVHKTKILTTLWGSLEPIDLRDFSVVSVVNNRPSHRITIRYIDFLPDKFVFIDSKDSRRYVGTAVVNVDEQNKALQFLVVEE